MITRQSLNWKWYDLVIMVLPLALLDLVFFRDSDYLSYAVKVNGKEIYLVTTTLALVVVWHFAVLYQIVNMLMGNPKDRLIV